MARMYEITSTAVEPVSDLLKAAVEINWHRTVAGMNGWAAELSIDPETGDLQVKVTHPAPWPSPQDDKAA